MHIQNIEIGNFRKLQAVRIDFSEKNTVFVGANNSGKTSAMAALRCFLVDPSAFSFNDFTLTHWITINSAALKWESAGGDSPPDVFEWGTVLPFVDVWLDVPTHDLHYVQKLLPTLDWIGPSIGVRLRFQPKDEVKLRQEYLKARADVAAIMAAHHSAAPSSNTGESGVPVSAPSEDSTSTFALWPQTMTDFLSRRLRATFEVRAYLLDPAALTSPANGLASPQALPAQSEPLDADPFQGLIQIDEISAQRGFGHTGAARFTRGDDAADEPQEHAGGRKLSTQLRSYYTHHLDPFDRPEPHDLEALQALHVAQTAFGVRLTECFAGALKELEDIGYPGVTDPTLTITTNIKPIDGLRHGSAVQYEVPTRTADKTAGHRLPEDSNGLGYQNLVSMVFALMSFRDKWMRVGKASNPQSEAAGFIPPLHLVLIEEPEAHLHAQVQQVFIKQAYEVLRKHPKLGDAPMLRTQLVVSTHSSHLAHEADFASLRYFRRLPAPPTPGSVPISSVVNLSEIFDGLEPTQVFVKRYLKATHCDLFFADGAVLIEGPAERILVPHLVRERAAYAYLRRCYITWLEIGGSHAHRLRSLIEHLGLNTLIITDIDAKDGNGDAVSPQRNSAHKARNQTLKTWLPKEDSLDALLDKSAVEKVFEDSSGYGIRVAYQTPISMVFKNATTAEALANTFEDALVYENPQLFTGLRGHGLIAKFREALTDAPDLGVLVERIRTALKSGDKAEFALDLLYSEEIKDLRTPAYIHEGLEWLTMQLKRKERDTVGNSEGSAT
jgi:predicted ATP-dependent endonuclease of OLD family